MSHAGCKPCLRPLRAGPILRGVGGPVGSFATAHRRRRRSMRTDWRKNGVQDFLLCSVYLFRTGACLSASIASLAALLRERWIRQATGVGACHIPRRQGEKVFHLTPSERKSVS
ncbi:hypothetical protein FN846DRAFT_907110 [Sphaerosporella brunnea]|uniref:Uncharacterized protein n=1 Tax=Sphaerosporella brunnea TaxID=1250544 RepID=A0A5J5EXX4_9PEZI|nr:hypothetical protein FN846DRAFT_907110 [Sphaerosporella brunnea]